MRRWVHPDVISRAAPLPLAAALGLLVVDYAAGLLFHAGGGAAMLPLEHATRGWIHHSLAWGAITSTLVAALAFAAGVRFEHLGLDRRELRRWIATWMVSWCAVQLVMVGASQLAAVPPLRLEASVPASVGVMLALLLHTGLFEEIVARGIVLPVLVRRFGVVTGISVGALTFALGHVPVLLGQDPSFADMLGSLAQYWFWAVITNVLYLRSASLLTVAALHAVADAPTPFAIDDHLYTILFVTVHLGGAAYILLRRWPVTSRTAVAS